MTQSQFTKLETQRKHSGLSVFAFCRKQGIAYGTFHYWRRKFTTANSSPSPQSSFLELIPSAPHSHTQLSPDEIKVETCGLVFRMPPQTTKAQWKELLSAAREIHAC